MKRVIVAFLALGLLGGCSGGPDPSAGPSSAATPGLGAGSFVRPASMTGEPCGFEVSEQDLWILTCSGTLLKIPKRGSGSSAQHLGGEVLSLDGLVRGSSGRLWALASRRSARERKAKVVPVSLPAGGLGTAVDVGASVPMSAAEAGGRLWVAMLDGRLLELRDGAVREAGRGVPLMWAAADDSSLWTVDEDGHATLRNASDDAPRSTTDGVVPEPLAAAAAFGSLWVSTPSKIVSIDAATGVPRTLAVDGTVNAIASCGDAVWLSQPDFGVRSLSPAGTVVAALRLEVAPRYLACDGSLLWVLAEDGRVGSVRIT